MSRYNKQARRTNATIDQTIGSVHSFYAFHARMGIAPALPLYQLSLPDRRAYKPFLHGIAKTKPEQRRVVTVKREQHTPKTLTQEQVQTLIDACTHTRDKFLLTLMYQTGMRVGQCLGLKPEDLIPTCVLTDHFVLASKAKYLVRTLLFLNAGWYDTRRQPGLYAR